MPHHAAPESASAGSGSRSHRPAAVNVGCSCPENYPFCNRQADVTGLDRTQRVSQCDYVILAGADPGGQKHLPRRHPDFCLFFLKKVFHDFGPRHPHTQTIGLHTSASARWAQGPDFSECPAKNTIRLQQHRKSLCQNVSGAGSGNHTPASLWPLHPPMIPLAWEFCLEFTTPSWG